MTERRKGRTELTLLTPSGVLDIAETVSGGFAVDQQRIDFLADQVEELLVALRGSNSWLESWWDEGADYHLIERIDRNRALLARWLPNPQPITQEEED